ncbi:MAG: Oxidoreductase, aldo/keto reductase family [uncultured Craurococcus sp.]|uniref:Oxidoreductase, aldo/keto reductase family n=1 Tax=uncultured Craurococcus sp. TaxID=1135998 RepID=A0A6J4JVZ9_9PROT|nr:MAG: Oxidoreductase, aldo/keto reductase family [uncultured Craurococcus sp.]
MAPITLADGTEVPALGQGTWNMGERGSDRRREADALRLGLDLGMTLIDTAEMYAEGGAEEVVAEAIAGRRSDVFLVSKVYPHNAVGQKLEAALERSLRRLRTESLDLYLLHWRGSVPLEDTVAAMERMRAAGKIRRWGVSNLDVDDLEELGPALADCAADQVLYNLEHRGVEFDLLPFCRERRMPVMAYSPVGQGGALLRHPALQGVARRLGATPAQVAIAWTLRQGGVISIPKAADAGHVRLNAAAGELRLAPEDLAALDAAFPPPRRKRALAML